MSIHNYLTSKLPIGIVISIYEYDPTYRICNDKKFNDYIINYKINKKIRNYIDGLLEDGCLWITPFGTFTNYEEDVSNNDIWLDIHYNILFNRFDNYVLFSIVPKYINNTNIYDGFICYYRDFENIPNEIINQYRLFAYIFNGVIKNDQMMLYIK